ncbi:MAG: ribosome recycling factor [Candidatus Levyibacteriota bacterium]
MEELVSSAKVRMQKVLEVLKTDLSTVRTGRAAPSLVENIIVSVYGGTQKLKVVELAHVSSSDLQTLQIAPYDASIIGELNKGIMEANVGLTPNIDGQMIRISIPSLSEERREELVHLVGQKLEGAKIQIRQIRHEAMNDIKKQETKKLINEDEKERLEKEVQKETDKAIDQVEELGTKKKEELLQV